MTPSSPARLPRLAAGLAGWLLIGTVMTVALWTYREQLDQAHMALAYLLVVLGASAREGRVVGLVVAVASFLAFDFFLLHPLYRLAIADPLEWWILVAFLTTAAVAAELLHRQQQAVALAERRAAEIERLSQEAGQLTALREATRLKDELLATVSHDLRTPLTSIRATAAEIRAEGVEAAAVIEEEAERLSRYVTDLLDLSRIRGGRTQLDPQLYAAEDLVGAALERVRGLPGGSGIRVTMPSGGEIPVGRFDFVQALCSLVNLVENALRHTPGGVGIDLLVSRRADDLVFEVMDRGPGIAEADSGRVFEAFYRGSASKGAGTGLGLTIAREAARLQGGSVDFRPRPGGGSIFSLRLPAEDVEGLS